MVSVHKTTPNPGLQPASSLPERPYTCMHAHTHTHTPLPYTPHTPHTHVCIALSPPHLPFKSFPFVSAHLTSCFVVPVPMRAAITNHLTQGGLNSKGFFLRVWKLEVPHWGDSAASFWGDPLPGCRGPASPCVLTGCVFLSGPRCV